MLIKLSVENYALIEHLEMEWDKGLNIITGQTGAGKSILLGALGLVVGNRADTTALKDNDKNCVVEGTFDLSGYNLEPFFTANDLEYDPTTTIRRIITPAGKSRSYVNDLPVQITTLKELGAMLIDIHSQHQSLMVGDGNFRMKIVDGVADNSKEREEYGKIFTMWRDCQHRLNEIRDEAARNKKDEEYVRYQYDQLAALHLHEGELTELETERKELSNTELIEESLGSSAQLLDEEENGILIKLKTVESSLRHIVDVYPASAELAERIHAAAVELKDITSTIDYGAQKIEADPKRLDEVNTRLDAIYSLFQKHHVDSVEELMGLEREFAAKLEMITDSDEIITRTEQEEKRLYESARELAARLTRTRETAAGELSEGVEKTLIRLGFESARFICAVEPLGTITDKGADEIRFMFSANRNSTPQQLEKIASGGEISRVMLCLKAFVAKSTKLPTIIFDEIDTGVSGRIADVTGEIIAELSQSMQVMNITHLPQVASKGHTHFMVYKQEQDGTVKTRIKLLDREERIEEIAKMLSGSKVTSAAIEQAKSLLGENGNRHLL